MLSGDGPILLDFDGPVCNIFANYPAPKVAEELRAVLVECGVDVPASVKNERDPLEVLRWVGRQDRPEVTEAAEDALVAAEQRAAMTAAPTPGSHELLAAAKSVRRQVAIVSNNSAQAISVYLDSHHLRHDVARIQGRVRNHPELMKPDPTTILLTVRALDARPRDCVFIGDSLSDVASARAAGVPLIAYANKPGKQELFEGTYSRVVISDLLELVLAIHQTRSPGSTS